MGPSHGQGDQWIHKAYLGSGLLDERLGLMIVVTISVSAVCTENPDGSPHVQSI